MTLMFVVCTYLFACTPEISFSEADLVGFYVANYGGDTATLTLLDDHTYAHVVTFKGGHAEQKDTWKRSQVTAEGSTRTVVDFNDFRVTPAFAEAKKRGWAVEVDRDLFGHIELCFDSDVGYCYIKQSRN